VKDKVFNDKIGKLPLILVERSEKYFENYIYDPKSYELDMEKIEY
jgi:hypothetical protein